MTITKHSRQLFAVLAATAIVALSGCSDRTATSPGRLDLPQRALSTSDTMARYIVLLRGSPDDAAGRAGALVRAGGGRLRYVYSRVLNGFAAEFPRSHIAGIRAHPEVAAVRIDAYARAFETQSAPPNWGLDRIDQRVRPLNAAYQFERNGAGTHVYIFDTGVSPVADLAGRLGPGIDAISGGASTADCNGHGTHVASTAAGTIYGVAKGATVHSFRVLDCTGGGHVSDVLFGMDSLTKVRVLPAVANFSLGWPSDPLLDQAAAQLMASGVIVVAAAGNANQNACGFSPAGAANVLTVGASTQTDGRLVIDAGAGSNFGSCVEVFAPGHQIRAAWYLGSPLDTLMSGTSMAAPHVTGTVAQYLQEFPSATQATVASQIAASATAGVLSNVGTGSPNRLLFSWYANDAPFAQIVASGCGPHYCTLTSGPAYDDGGVASYYWYVPGANPSSSYSSGMVANFYTGGTKQVWLTVTDAQGRTRQVTSYISVP